MTTKANAAEATKKAVEKLTVKILRVSQPEGNEQRISFWTNQKFKTIDYNSQEEIESDKFGINAYNLINQVRAFVPEIQLAETMAMGQQVNPQIIALALINSEMNIEREFKSADELRYNGEETYGRDLYMTKILSVRTNILPQFQLMINKLIMEKPAIVKKASAIDYFDI